MGGFVGLLCAYSLIPLTAESLGFLYMHTLASVADPRLFDPRVGDDKNTSLHSACNRHLPMVELPNATGPTGKTEPGAFIHLRQGLLLDHSGIEGVSSRIILSHLGQ